MNRTQQITFLAACAMDMPGVTPTEAIEIAKLVVDAPPRKTWAEQTEEFRPKETE